MFSYNNNDVLYKYTVRRSEEKQNLSHKKRLYRFSGIKYAHFGYFIIIFFCQWKQINI